MIWELMVTLLDQARSLAYLQVPQEFPMQLLIMKDGEQWWS